jgi:3-oxoacyl-[acyl-carrier protein] reductase
MNHHSGDLEQENGVTKLTGKVAVVTSAAMGTGAAIAEHLARQGASVVITFQGCQEAAGNVVDRIAEFGGKVMAIEADLCRVEDARHVFSRAKATFSQLNVLVNNVQPCELLPLELITTAHFFKQFNRNILQLILASQEATLHFGPAGGSIINVTSMITSTAPSRDLVCSATKAAIGAVTRSLAEQFASRHIRVNSIDFSTLDAIDTVRPEQLGEDFYQRIRAYSPMRQQGQRYDVAPAAAFLASSESAWITGESICI